MAFRRKPNRDLTTKERLARGPVDVPFLMLVCLLLGIGLIMMFSASYATAFYDSTAAVSHDPLYYIIRQAVFAVIGLVVMFAISRINYEKWRKAALPLLGVAILLLILVIPFGYGRQTVGAQRWMRMFIIAGPGYQPSEIAKLAVIIFFAARLSIRDTEMIHPHSVRTTGGRFLNWMERTGLMELVPYAAVMIVVEALLAAEPHMSGMILMLVGAAAILWVAGIQLRWFALGGVLAGGGLWLIINKTSYMRSRIELWRNPWIDAQGKGYQTIQSLYAIASGNVLGLGFGNSRQKMLYIPEPQNDFVFPIVVEELGFVGAMVVLLLFALLILRGYWLALHARDRFGMMVIVGINTLFAAQVFLNIGVVTNLIPNTGISLPFFSYGGTALVIHMAEMGIILAVSRQIPAPEPAKKKKEKKKE